MARANATASSLRPRRQALVNILNSISAMFSQLAWLGGVMKLQSLDDALGLRRREDLVQGRYAVRVQVLQDDPDHGGVWIGTPTSHCIWWAKSCMVRRSVMATRIASNHMLLNFGYTKSPGRSSHEIGVNWPPSSGRLAAMHWRTRFGYPSFRRPPTY